MVLAGLAASGVTTVSNVNYIDRGYENMVEKLQGIGARIRRDSGREDPQLSVITGNAV
jgi:UDP-N-acetylglucosamine 1-carboxyvinyltransferase